MIDMIEDIAAVKLERNYQLDKPKGVRGRSSDNENRERDKLDSKINLRSDLKTYEWIFNQIKSGSNLKKFTRSY